MREIAGLVPQVFYDLIGRFVPGGVVLAVAALLFIDLSVGAALPSLAERMTATSLILLAAGLAYALASVLGAIGFALVNWEWTTKPVERISVDIPANPGARRLTRGQVAFLYDALRFHHPATGALLVKLRAEQHMSLVFMVGALILLLMCGLVDRPRSSPVSTVVAVPMLALLFGGSYLLYVHLAVRARRLLMNHWQIVPELAEAVTRINRRQIEPDVST
jgi:hypothetical protein